MLAASGLVIWTLLPRNSSSSGGGQGGEPPPLPKDPINIDGAPALGSTKARAAVLVYSDFECPFCGQFARETWPSLQKEYVDTGRIRVFFRNLPLERKHPLAMKAAGAGLCAAEQGKFWLLHDRMFAKSADLTSAGLRLQAGGLEIDLDAFDACVTRPETAAKVRSDAKSAASLGIRATPSFVVGSVKATSLTANVMLSGAQPYAQFKAALDTFLQDLPQESTSSVLTPSLMVLARKATYAAIR
jgi:protein-disulfide isomerase